MKKEELEKLKRVINPELIKENPNDAYELLISFIDKCIETQILINESLNLVNNLKKILKENI